MVNSNAKGDRKERELVRRLYDDGFATMRAPASGSATGRDLPDIIAGNGDVTYCIEAKSSSGDPIYLDGEEIDSLVYFATNFGAIPVVAARFNHLDWAFFTPDTLYQTQGGNYRVKRERAADPAAFDGVERAELKTKGQLQYHATA